MNALISRRNDGGLAGAPISGATVTLSDTPASGTYAQYQLSGQPPAAATQAVVGFRVNIEGAGPEPSDFSLYQASYIQTADGIERVVNGGFLAGDPILEPRRTSSTRPQRSGSRAGGAGSPQS